MESHDPTITLTHPVFQPKTTDELYEQWRRWQEDELDQHDAIVLVWKAQFLAKLQEDTDIEQHILERKAMEIRHDRERTQLLVKRRFELGLSLPNGWRDMMEGKWPNTPEEEAQRVLGSRPPGKAEAWLSAGMVA